MQPMSNLQREAVLKLAMAVGESALVDGESNDEALRMVVQVTQQTGKEMGATPEEVELGWAARLAHAIG